MSNTTLPGAEPTRRHYPGTPHGAEFAVRSAEIAEEHYVARNIPTYEEQLAPVRRQSVIHNRVRREMCQLSWFTSREGLLPQVPNPPLYMQKSQRFAVTRPGQPCCVGGAFIVFTGVPPSTRMIAIFLTGFGLYASNE
jgi:hypothetical protein